MASRGSPCRPAPDRVPLQSIPQPTATAGCRRAAGCPKHIYSTLQCSAPSAPAHRGACKVQGNVQCPCIVRGTATAHALMAYVCATRECRCAFRLRPERGMHQCSSSRNSGSGAPPPRGSPNPLDRFNINKPGRPAIYTPS